MPYTMTHVLIAEKVLEHIDRQVDYNTYILGATAPDAVHASKDFCPEMKSRSHLVPDGLVWGHISLDGDFEKWLAKAGDFYRTNKNKYDKDFLLGYTVHILTDIFACKELYVPFLLAAGDRLEEETPVYKRESYAVNYRLYEEYSREKDLKKILSEGRSDSLEGVFDNSVLEPRLEQLFSFEFNNMDIGNITENRIMTMENSMAVIEKIPEIIIKEGMF